MKIRDLVVLASGVLFVGGISIAGSGDDHGGVAKESQPLPNCPVMDEPINLAVSTETVDGPVFFCCGGCIKKYNGDSAKYAAGVAAQRKVLAKRTKVQTTCPVSGKTVNKKVSIDEDGKRVYFCSEDCVSKYRSDPQKYAAALANSFTYQTICPVMGEGIDPKSFTTLSDGRKIYYCCDGCKEKLFGNPAKYAKNLASQGYQYNWSKIKKADDTKHDGHDHGGHDHGKHGHDH